MIVAIHQPNYLPWCGYFAKLVAADVFVVLDDVLLSNGRSFVSRTAVLGPHGRQWLSAPISRAGTPAIAEARFAGSHWASQHLRALHAMYGHAAYAKVLLEPLRALYSAPAERIADFNLSAIAQLCSLLGLKTPVVRASKLGVPGNGSRHLLGLVQAVGGTTYLSGPSGRNYLEPAVFREAGVDIRYGEYVATPYPQDRAEFVPALSIVDALCHIGPAATRELLSYPSRSCVDAPA